jgi:hypothetical protein
MAKKNQKRKNIKNDLIVAVAVLTERVLEDPDHVFSLIRVVDKITIKGPIPFDAPGMPSSIGQLVGFLSLKSPIKRKVKIGVEMRSPSGKMVGSAPDIPLAMEGNWFGGVVRVNIAFPIAERGHYWMHFSVDGRRVAKTPLFVEYQKASLEEIMGQQQPQASDKKSS